jgi:photosystem II stability/assembly factor-like uncharacterized protein
MKKLFLLFLICIIYQSSYSQWFQSYHIDYVEFNKIQFVNELTGYIVGEDWNNWGGVILKTTDGGNNWMNLTSDSLFPIPIFAISFINANTGFVSGYSMNIYKTTNGGLNWSYTQAPSLGNSRYRALQFLNENTGYIGGRYGRRFKTTNGGITWDTLSEAETQLYSIFFFNVNTGFMGDAFRSIYKTTNGGLNWSSTILRDTSSSASTYMITHIDFLNEMTGYIAGATGSNSRGAIFKTTNQGNNWINIFYQDNLELYGIDLVNDTTIFAAGYEGKVLKTSNGGNTWSITQVPNVNWTLYSIRFINENTGFTSGFHNVFKTTNGGVYVNQISSEIPERFSLYQNYPNPFNPNTNIKFNLPKSSYVKLTIYDILGKEVAVLVNENLNAGSYIVDWNASDYPSGIYFYRLVTGDFVGVKKMLLVK